MCTLPSANDCVSDDHSVTFCLAERSEAVSGGDLEGRRGRSHRPGPGSCLPLLHPGSGVLRPGCMGTVQRNTRSRGGGSVSSTLHTYPGLVSVSPGCFQRCFPFPQLGLFPKQLADLFFHGLPLQLHLMQLERLLTCTQR